MTRLAFISGVEGPELLAEEVAFFKETRPLGLILFARNLESEVQISRLVGDVRAAVGEDQFWVLIDQEGGRVQRLVPPLFPRLPAGRCYGELFAVQPEKALRAAELIGQFMAQRLLALGINVNCTPVLDAAQDGAHEIISDRSFGCDPSVIAALGRAHAAGHLKGGVLPVIKHIPGHGRAMVDSHHDLPVIEAPLSVLQDVDFAPFRMLSDLPLAMTAHVIYSDFDASAPVSTSATAIAELIRRDIGFDGFLMCDDVSMQALEGSIAARSKAVMAAGCDGALHCNGVLAEMREVASEVPVLAGAALTRFERSFDLIAKPEIVDEAAALTLLQEGWTEF